MIFSLLIIRFELQRTKFMWINIVLCSSLYIPWFVYRASQLDIPFHQWFIYQYKSNLLLIEELYIRHVNPYLLDLLLSMSHINSPIFSDWVMINAVDRKLRQLCRGDEYLNRPWQLKLSCVLLSAVYPCFNVHVQRLLH